jgi:4-hydroxy 2-oxovalerate aldolase
MFNPDGDGLNWASFNNDFGAHTEWGWISQVAKVVKRALPTTLLLPGSAQSKIFVAPLPPGATSVRIVANFTEVDIAKQHIGFARKLGTNVSGSLMMSHMSEPKELVQQANLMEDYGVHCVCVTDNGNALNMDGYREWLQAYDQVLGAGNATRRTAHHNLSLGVANSIVAAQSGAPRIDVSLVGVGTRAGNAPLKVFIAAANRKGWSHGCDVFALMYAAEELVRPLQDRPVQVDCKTLSPGYAGVYSSSCVTPRRPARATARTRGRY